jgi:hypothetical protein
MKQSFGPFFIFTVMIVALVADLPASGRSSELPVASVNASGGAGIKGYDPVAYFTTRQPAKGADRYSLQWHGVYAE